MKPAHLLMTLLVVANVSLWAVGLSVYDRPNAESECLLGLLMAHAGLLGIWLGLGRAPFPVRLIVVSVGVLLFEAVMERWRPEFHVLPALLFFDVFCVSVPYLVMRMFGVRLVNLEGIRPTREVATRQSGFQFSLRTMFAWTTAVAFLFSAFATIGFQQIAEVVLDLRREVPFFITLSLLVSLLLPLLVLVVETPKRTIAVFVLLLCLVVLAIEWNSPEGFFFLAVAVLLFSLAVCRVAGYRLIPKTDQP